MFESIKEHPDLIFNDATVQLIEINKPINEYLGKDLIAMLYRTDDRLCNKSQRTFYLNFYLFILVLTIL
jgi:hypothetical protein